MPWKSRDLTRIAGKAKLNSENLVWYNYGSQATFSESHDWPDGARSGANIGGPFYSDKNWMEYFPSSMSWEAGGSFLEGFRPKYSGNAMLGMLGFGSTTPLVGGNFEPTPSSELVTMAGPVIKNMSPTESEVGLAQAIGELKRDGMPRLIGADIMESRARDFRAYGKEYLNTEFGWIPFLSDIQDFGRAVQDSDRIMRQFQQDSGRLIRRKANLPPYHDTVEADEGTYYASPLTGDCWQVISRPVTSVTTIRKERWVVAAYTYYLDPGDTLLGKFNRFNQQADRLLGLSLSPETLWELAPWSWAVDWFSNVGNAVSTLSDWLNFGPALKYAYVMETTTSRRDYTGSGFVDKIGGSHALSCAFHRQVKVREPATPFVFRHVDGELSSQQLAIIAALGISHAP